VEHVDEVDVQALVDRLREVGEGVRIQAVARPPADVVRVENPGERLHAGRPRVFGRRDVESNCDIPESPQRLDPPVEDVARGRRRCLLEDRACVGYRKELTRLEEGRDRGDGSVGIALFRGRLRGADEHRRSLALSQSRMPRRSEPVLRDGDVIRPEQSGSVAVRVGEESLRGSEKAQRRTLLSGARTLPPTERQLRDICRKQA